MIVSASRASKRGGSCGSWTPLDTQKAPGILQSPIGGPFTDPAVHCAMAHVAVLGRSQEVSSSGGDGVDEQAL